MWSLFVFVCASENVIQNGKEDTVHCSSEGTKWMYRDGGAIEDRFSRLHKQERPSGHRNVVSTLPCKRNWQFRLECRAKLLLVNTKLVQLKAKELAPRGRFVS